MGKLCTGMFLLFVLLVPVSCKEFFFIHPIVCYFLDGILIFYCLLATVFFLREKFSHVPSVDVEVSENNGGIYQELERPMDADPYQVLEASNRKKKAGKKKKPKLAQPERTDEDPYESLAPGAPRPPLSPR